MNKTAIVAALIIGISILGYGFLDYKYKNRVLDQKIKSEQAQRESEEQSRKDEAQKAEQEKTDYKNCKDTAYENYMGDWNSQCKIQGLKDGCTLLRTISDKYNEGLQKEFDTCTKIYTDK